MNIWSYDPETGSRVQLTKFRELDCKALEAGDGHLIFENGGYLYIIDTNDGKPVKLNIDVSGDFSWARPHWEDVSEMVASAAVSPTGKRAVFEARGDIFTVPAENGDVRNLTKNSSSAERSPAWSPDGKWIAFTSNRYGSDAVYLVSVEGGEAKRLTWHPNGSRVRGWTNDGKNILFASDRDASPTRFDRLWTVSVNGGPATLLTSQWSTSGAFSKDGKNIVIDRMSRWDEEWRAYRGGQNTPLIILNLNNLQETLLPNNQTTDIKPIWLDDTIYFLSDRDYVANIWSLIQKRLNLIR